MPDSEDTNVVIGSNVDIVVENVGVPQVYDMVSRLVTDSEDEGNVKWMLLRDVPVKTLYVYQNGEYLAIDDGVYGYDEVYVNVPVVEDDWDDPFDPDWDDDWDDDWGEEEDYCVSGYGEEDNVFYMACQHDGELLVRPFPSYIVLREKSKNEREWAAEDRDGEGGQDNGGMSIGLYADLMLNNNEVYDTFDFDDYDGSVNVSNGVSISEVAGAIYDGDGRHVVYTNTDSGSQRGEASTISVDPANVFASPYWVLEFEEFMGQKFQAEDYVISGRGSTTGVKADYYHDGEYHDTIYGTGIDGVYSTDKNWQPSSDDQGLGD